MAFDLHMHSGISSDGQYSNEELLAFAKEAGLDTIALTDHDSTEGVKDMMEKGKAAGIDVIPGIECTTLLDGQNVHLLGYGIDPDDPYFKNLPETTRKLMTDAFHERVVRLEKKYGIHVDEEAIVKEAGDKNPWFLLIPAILSDPKAMEFEELHDYMPGGSRSDPAPVNFFWDKCMPGSDLYVYVNFPSFEDSVKKIHEAGGIAVVAHPFKTFYKNEERLQKAIDAGIEGLEAYSNYHDDEMCLWYKEFANDHDLLITCGSDFHGDTKPSIRMGEYHLHEDGTPYIQAVKEAIAKKQK